MKIIAAYFIVFLVGVGSMQAQTGAVRLNVNTDFLEFSPTVSGNGKTLIFQSNRDGGFRLYEATLQSDGSWSVPSAIDNINRFVKPDYIIGGPCLSTDGNTLYFCARLAGSITDMDIYVSKRNSKNEWGTPQNIGLPITTIDNETFPSISADGKKLFFTKTSSKGDDKCTKIMMSELSDRDKWSKPVEVVNPINVSCDKAPRITYDNKTLVYASNKNGSYDLYRSELGAGNTWTEPQPLDFVNSGEAELYGAVSTSEDYLYYTQKGDIYAMPIPENYKMHGLKLTGKVIDLETSKPMKAKLFLIDTLAKDTLKSMQVDGSYELTIPAAKPYKILALADKYYDYTAVYNASIDEKYRKEEVPIKLKYRRKEVVFKVADKDNNKGLKVKIKVTNVDTKEESIIEANAGRDGQYAVSLKEGNKYNVEISSIEGYAFSTTTIEVPLSTGSENMYASTSGMSSDTSRVSDAFSPNIDIKLQPLKDNTKLVLNDIYFQFNKFQLEKESFVELDRVVSLMKSNPSAIIEIAAHTDDIGSDDFNNNLSSKRAQEIVKYLNSKGISSSKLRPKGYGKTKPVDPATTEEARAKNRRVELKILDIK